MTARIRLLGMEAIIQDRKWVAENRELQSLLSSLLIPLGPSGADPNPDLTAAQEAMRILGGDVVNYDAVETVKGRVY